jgi:hypothetical protein
MVDEDSNAEIRRLSAKVEESALQCKQLEAESTAEIRRLNENAEVEESARKYTLL